MSDPFIGEVRVFANTYVPDGWLLCDGTSLPVQSSSVLYAVIGNLYGGDSTNFRLPNLNGRIAIGSGTPSRGQTSYAVGQTGGSEGVSLSMSKMPAHTHQLQKKNTSAAGPQGKTAVPDGTSDLGALSTTAGASYSAILPDGPANTVLSPSTLGFAGAQPVAPHENRQPFLGLLFAIATEGMFPTRD